MTRQDKNTLEKLLIQFFNEADLSNNDFMHRNSTAQILKSNLEREGRWKRLSRGSKLEVKKRNSRINRSVNDNLFKPKSQPDGPESDDS